jgi:predicted nucleic acid-binding protein
MTKKIAIQDANIMIDLIKTGLFDYCLALNFNFSTTNIILNELYDEQVASIQPHISSGKFVVIEISIEELLDIQQMSEEDTRLSEQDWSAIYFAKEQDALILSGDQRLRNVAEAKGLATFGIIWLLDELVSNKIISTKEACNYLQDLIRANKRLPITECSKRIEIWCEVK